MYTLSVPPHISFKIDTTGIDGVYDPLREWIEAGTFGFGENFRLLFDLIQPGDYVLDAGAHIGTFSLASAALGAHVCAVEAGRANAAALRNSVAENAFENLIVVNNALGAKSGVLHFVENGAYGVVTERLSSVVRSDNEIAAISGQDLLQQLGWTHVDYIKLDVEGWEIPVLEGMAEILARDDAPIIVYESNSWALKGNGYHYLELRQALERFGYHNFLIDQHMLIDASAGAVQVDTIAELIAIKPRDIGKIEKLGWVISSRSSNSRTIDKICHEAKQLSVAHQIMLCEALQRIDLDVITNEEVLRALSENNIYARRAADGSFDFAHQVLGEAAEHIFRRNSWALGLAEKTHEEAKPRNSIAQIFQRIFKRQ